VGYNRLIAKNRLIQYIALLKLLNFDISIPGNEKRIFVLTNLRFL